MIIMIIIFSQPSHHFLIVFKGFSMANIRLSVSAGGDVVGSPKHREVNAAFGHPVRGVEGFVKWVGEWNLRTLWIQVVAFGSIGKHINYMGFPELGLALPFPTGQYLGH